MLSISITRRRGFSVLALAVLVAAELPSSRALAQQFQLPEPRLVRDLSPGGISASSSPEAFLKAPGGTWFAASTPEAGQELWRATSLDPNGVAQVLDLTPGPTGSGISDIRPVGGPRSERIVFSMYRGGKYVPMAFDPSWPAPIELPIFGTLIRMRDNAGGNLERIISDGTLAYYVDYSAWSVRVWRTDGTVARTSVIYSNSESSFTCVDPHEVTTPIIEAMVHAGGRLVFAKKSECQNSYGTELLAYDGSGVSQLGFYSSGVLGLSAVGNEFWYAAGGSSASAIYKTDGASPPISLTSFGSSTVFVRFGSEVFFAHGDSVHGRELWASDGTPAGTRMLFDLLPGTESSSPLLALGGAQSGVLYFSAVFPGIGRELGAIRPSGGGGYQVETFDINAGPQGSSPYGWVPASHTTPLGTTAYAYFSAFEPVHGRQVWRYGTSLERVSDFSEGAREIYGLDQRTLVLVGDTDVYGREPFVHTVATNATTLLRDIATGIPNFSAPAPGMEYGGEIYLPIGGNVPNLVRSNGQPNGTDRVGTETHYDAIQILGRLPEGVQYSRYSTSPYTELNRCLANGNGAIWESYLPISSRYRAIGNQSGNVIYFWIYDGQDWSLRARVAGQALPLSPVATPSGLRPDNLPLWPLDQVPQSSPGVSVNDRLVFAARSDLSSLSIYCARSDGQGGYLAEGPLADPPRDPREFIEWNGRVYFVADWYNPALGWFSTHSLWRSDGTLAGTVPLFRSMQNQQNGVYSRFGMVRGGRNLMFIAETSDEGLVNVSWQIRVFRETTGGGLQFVRLLDTYADSIDAMEVVPGTDTIVVLVSGSNGARTARVAELDADGRGDLEILPLPSPSWTQISLFATEHGVLLADANEANPQRDEIWITDLSSNLRPLAQIRPGPLSSNPRFLGRLGDSVLLAADDGTTGSEIWAIDLEPFATPIGGGCGSGGRSLTLSKPNLDWPGPGSELRLQVEQSSGQSVGVLLISPDALGGSASIPLGGGCEFHVDTRSFGALATHLVSTPSYELRVAIPNDPALTNLRVRIQVLEHVLATSTLEWSNGLRIRLSD